MAPTMQNPHPSEHGLRFTQWVQVWVGVIGGERFPIVASIIFKKLQFSKNSSPFVVSVNIESFSNKFCHTKA